MTHYSPSATHHGQGAQLPGTFRSQHGSGDFLGDLNEAVRQNPVPAALIGLGVLWLFLGGAKNTVLGGASRSLAGALGQGAQQAGGAAYRGARGMGGAISAGASSIAETAGEVGSQAAGAMQSALGAISGAASQAASQVAETAKSGYDAAGSMIGSAGDTASETAASGMQSVRNDSVELTQGFQRTLADLFTKQPLLLGAVGVAVGAAIAAAMPTSEVENRLMGDTADSLKEKAEDLWNETAKRAETMASKGLAEAKSQGLTPDAAGQALRGATEKLMGIAEKAKEEVAARVKTQQGEPSASASPAISSAPSGTASPQRPRFG